MCEISQHICETDIKVFEKSESIPHGKFMFHAIFYSHFRVTVNFPKFSRNLPEFSENLSKIPDPPRTPHTHPHAVNTHHVPNTPNPKHT